MATAKYTVLVPTRDEAGSPLSIAPAVHEYFTSGPLPVEAATVHHGSPFDAVVGWAEDSPEIDSHMKQVGVYVGEVANVPTVSVSKEGKAGAHWIMRNPHYVPGQPSDFASSWQGQVQDSPQVPQRNTNELGSPSQL